MVTRRSRVSWVFVSVGLLTAAVALLVVRAAGQVVHADPRAIPSVMQADPPPGWSGAAARARRIIQDAVAAQNVPGMSVAVGVEGAVVWAEGFGWADIKTQAPVTPDTRFRIGTASTVLTSAAAGVLLEQGKLTLDDEVQKYVPQFPRKRQPVTLRQLMADTAGVGTDSGDDGPLFRERCEQPVAALQHFANDPLLFEPGTRYRHSKYGWIVVSAAIEAAADEPFLTVMRDSIFEPLGMDNTGVESATEENPEAVGEPGEDAPLFTFIRQMILEPLGFGAAKARLATEPATVYVSGLGSDRLLGYDRFFRYRLHVMRPHNLSCYAGSMAYFSTPSDVVRFGLALNGGKLLQPATAGLLQLSSQLKSGQETGHGLGWDLAVVTLSGQPTEASGRDGELRGHRVISLMMFRETGLVVAVMANKANADTSAVALRVAEEFAN